MNNFVYGFAYICDGLFSAKIEYVSPSSSSYEISYTVNDSVSKTMLRPKLGHIGKDRMKRLADEVMLGDLTRIDLLVCEHCLAGKSTTKSLKMQLGLVIHSNICGTFNVRVKHDTYNFITFIDG